MTVRLTRLLARLTPTQREEYERRTKVGPRDKPLPDREKEKAAERVIYEDALRP